MAKITVNDIESGQRFEQRGGFVWQVVRLIHFPGESVPHVQLVNARDPSSTKTVSINALLDRSLFRQVAAER
jgi:hypothetical protein